ncbi:MAG: hypothetical protein D6693_00570 [Planctomycetota bacterium]|nr:MAG: hypothetical protein D6693_00570 [Planctomycetota bacterium]
MTERARINLDEALAAARTPIDAGWSKRKKIAVACASVGVALAALAGGASYHQLTRPPALPTTADEALAVLASDRFDRLDEERQRQYAAEAGRLLRALPPDQRRALARDEANREALAKTMQEMFDEVARRFARGQEPSAPPQERRGPREGRPGFNPEDITPEQRAQMRERMVERLNEQMAQAAESGNAQDSGLRAEMMKRRAAQRQQRGGRRGG